MKTILYMILGWATGELFHLTLWEWAKKKLKLKQNTVRGVFVFLFLALLLGTIAGGFYRVNTYQNVILTHITGEKTIINSTGIKYCMFSSRQPINLQKQIIRFPDFVPALGFQTTTRDKRPVLITSILEYQIIDVRKWGIENKNTLEKLKLLLKSATIHEAQNSDYEYLKENMKAVEDQLFTSMKVTEELYGVKILKVDIFIVDDSEVQKAKSDAEASKIKSQALKDSYTSEAEALRIKYNAISDVNFIKYMELMHALTSGKINTIIVPNNMAEVSAFNLGGATTTALKNQVENT